MFRNLYRYGVCLAAGSLLIAGTVRAQTDRSPEDHAGDLTNFSDYPLLRNGMVYGMESSYDRSGGNDDGFSGKWSVRYRDHGNVCIADIKGKGRITRIWFPQEKDYPGAPLGIKDKEIRFYIDGQDTPALHLPVVALFNQSQACFPYPLCGMGLGGCWCYVPISFNRQIQVEVEGEKANFFQVQYALYPQKQTPMDEHLPCEGYRDPALAPFWHIGDYHYLTQAPVREITQTYTLNAGRHHLSCPSGPGILRGIVIRGGERDLEQLLDGTLRISWDGAKDPAVRTPLSMFFLQEKTGLKDRSLLCGQLPFARGVYNYFPMPYRKKGDIELDIPRACTLVFTLLFEPLPVFKNDLCYLHIHHRKEYPTTPGKRFVWLDVSGRGHFAGLYLRAAGPSLTDSSREMIHWTGCLEGDEELNVDGQVVESGTGTEDYFNAGWNGATGKLDHAGTFPMHGFTLFDAAFDSSRIAAYRWRLPSEVVPFTRHFTASIEVGPTDQDKGNYESIAYYYLQAP